MLSIIHLSDAHIKGNEDPILSRSEAIYNALKNRINTDGEVIIIFSGDLAFSGKEDEYFACLNFLEELQKKLNEYTDKEIDLFTVPGNHDCDFSLPNINVRNTIVEKIIESKAEDISEDFIKICCSTQDKYFEAVDLVTTDVEVYQKLFLRKLFKAEGKQVAINGFNTAWLSRKNEKRDSFFPLGNIPDEFQSNNQDLTIGVFHHPVNWLNEENYRDFRQYVESTCDLILTGHEHVGEVRRSSNLENDQVDYLEAGALQNSASDQSEFRLIHVDIEKSQYSYEHFYWDSNSYEVEHSVEDIPFSKKTLNNYNGFKLSDDFAKRLNDPGTNFTHPRIKKLKLSDIFVSPRIRKIDISDEQNKFENVIDLNKVIENKLNLSSFHLLFTGEEKSGKTTICKKLYQKSLDNDFLPIYMDGNDIKSTSRKDFKKIVQSNFIDQYSESQKEKFEQIDISKTVLIIDNIDKSKLNNKYRGKLLSKVYEDYDKTIITGDDFFNIEELINNEKGEDLTGIYDKYEILEFGHLLRAELIDKWNLLGHKEYVTEVELTNKNDQARKTIETVIGKNYVPAHPIFLLTILQSIELGHQTNLQASSYGHYYEYLITQSLNKSFNKHDEINTIYNYLTDLAYELFSKSKREFSKTEFQEFHKWYCSEYSINEGFNNFEKKLRASSILEAYSQDYLFKYKYVYYYFVARYFSNNLSNEEIKVQISSMSNKLHNEEVANIFMFLTHLSKNPFVLDQILNSSKKIFEDTEIIKLDNDVKSINNLLEELPIQVLKERNYKDTREEKYRQKDRLEFEKKKQIEAEEDENELGIMSEFNRVYKTLEILGQILKNYYGSLKGDQKYSIGTETYFVGLRALNFLFQFLEENSEVFVNEIEKKLSEKEDDQENIEKSEIEEQSKKIFFQIATLISYSFIKKISSSVGYSKLEETFKSIMKANSFNSVKLIDISIKLDHYSGLPFSDLSSLNKDFAGNPLANTILKKMVINYLYMFPTTVKDKQRICDMLNIPMRAQRRIDATSTRKKNNS